MAIEILFEGAKVPQCITHDLESLFYVLIWICTMYKEPWNHERVFHKEEHLPLFSWYDNTSGRLDINADTKSRHCGTLATFTMRILNHFAPYFDDLKECCLGLWSLFFSEPRVDISHDEMHDIHQKTLNGLSLETPAENPVTPQSASIEDINAIYCGVCQPTVQEGEEGELFASDNDNGEMEAEDDESNEDIKDNDGSRKPAIIHPLNVLGFLLPAYSHRHGHSASPTVYSSSPSELPAPRRQ